MNYRELLNELQDILKYDDVRDADFTAAKAMLDELNIDYVLNCDRRGGDFLIRGEIESLKNTAAWQLIK